MTLTAKTALITGGGSGIGAATAQLLAAQGLRVAIAGRRGDRLQAVADQIREALSASGVESAAPPILCRTVDVGEREQVRKLIEWAEQELGAIDLLVNSAGVNVRARSIHSLQSEDWERILRINATGAFYCIQAALPAMLARRDGMIININSIAGLRAGLLGGAAYNASKFALSALGLTVGQEVREQGVRVTNIYPGEVETPILDDRPEPVSAEHRARILQPEDVAQAVLFVASLPPRANVPELVIKPTLQPYA